MVRGTTPTYIFFMPFEAELIADMRISFKQGDEVIVVKRLADAKLAGNTVSVVLEQEETLKFDCRKRIVKIELKVKTTSGVVASSGTMFDKISECINEEVL